VISAERDTESVMVGLTGGIGAGKSAVAARLAELGAVIVDADVLAREVVAPGTEGLGEIVATFGDAVLDADGALDRPALGRIVFDDPDARRRLEAIIHPRVRARTAEIVAAAPADAVVVNDVPLLVETGIERGFALVIVVLAEESTRIARLTGDRGMTEADARGRIAAQATDAQRRAAADVVITNDGTLDALRAQVDNVWRTHLSREHSAADDSGSGDSDSDSGDSDSGDHGPSARGTGDADTGSPETDDRDPGSRNPGDCDPGSRNPGDCDPGSRDPDTAREASAGPAAGRGGASARRVDDQR
jgi:dephospho-CoA kinase